MSIGWILFILAAIGWHIGMYGMFKKAGIAPLESTYPFLQYLVHGGKDGA